jgi:hypothetical protein
MSAIQVIDQKVWDGWCANNQDPYGSGVVRFAERWAVLMQQKLTEGNSVSEIADDASREADTEGITGFMYGCAVQMLAGCWVHGEELRRWHNLDTQIGTEGESANTDGGVLNPALLNIKTN